MSVLFGDSTDTDLQLDYLYLVRDIIGYAVDVLVAAEQINVTLQAARAAEASAASDRKRVEAVRTHLTATVKPDGDDGSPATRVIESILTAGDRAVDAELSRIDESLARERSFADGAASRQRTVCQRALERLLLMPHTLPGAEEQLDIRIAGDKGYSAVLRARAPYGLETELELDVPEGNLFGGVVLASQVSPGLEVHLPEPRGWRSKKIKSVRYKLGKHTVTRVRISVGRVTVSLRHPTNADAGFDLMLDPDWTAPRVVALDESGAPDVEAAADCDPGDESAIRILLSTLVDNAEAIRSLPTALASARLDDVPLTEHDDPTELVDRLIEHIGPTVRAIAEHSLGSDELVLKRQIATDRREEIYVNKRDLTAKLEALEPEQRLRLAPLGLFELPPPPPAQLRRAARGTAPPPPPGSSESKQALKQPERRLPQPMMRIPKRAGSQA